MTDRTCSRSRRQRRCWKIGGSNGIKSGVGSEGYNALLLFCLAVSRTEFGSSMRVEGRRIRGDLLC